MTEGYHSDGVVDSTAHIQSLLDASVNFVPCDDAIPTGEPKPHECPSCGRLKHSAPLTEMVYGMLISHKFSPTYNPDEDESRILCVYPLEGPVPSASASAWELLDVESLKWPETTWWVNVGTATLPDFTPPKPLQHDIGLDFTPFNNWTLGEKLSPAEKALTLLEGVMETMHKIELPQYEVDYQPIIDKANKPAF